MCRALFPSISLIARICSGDASTIRLSINQLTFSVKVSNRGESLFLRKRVLGIPAQASSKNLTRPLMPPAAPIRPRHLVPTQQGVGT